MEDAQGQYTRLTQNFPKIIAKEEGKEDYRYALNSLNNEVTSHLRAEAHQLLQLGFNELDKENYDEAYKFFGASKTRLPNPQAWFCQGLTNYHRDNLARAVEEFSAAILMYKDDDEASDAYYYRAKSVFEILINAEEITNERNDAVIGYFKMNLYDLVEKGVQEAQDLIDKIEEYTTIKLIEDLNLDNFYIESPVHLRFENGQYIPAQDGPSKRGIKIERNIWGNEGYTVTIFNLDGDHPLWGSNVQRVHFKLSPDVISLGDD